MEVTRMWDNALDYATKVRIAELQADAKKANGSKKGVTW